MLDWEICEWEINDIEYWQINYIESLLSRSNIDHEERSSIERSLKSLKKHEADDLIAFLKENQLDPIIHGMPYTATDISNHIKRIM